MKEHPILFSAPMVCALLADRKHVTRRLSKSWLKVKAGDRLWVRETWCRNPSLTRDPFNLRNPLDILYRADCPDAEPPKGAAITRDRLRWLCLHDCTWKPSIHMPRWASRILLECEEDARVERLHDLTEEDAIAEGVSRAEDHPTFDKRECPRCHGSGLFSGGSLEGVVECDCGLCDTAIKRFANLWGTLHTKPGETWNSNPEVVRVGRFHRVGGTL
jgi:hypothetical protein